jgi:phosphoserine aminotransferase
MTRAHNFNAGPAVLPLPVLEKAQAELLNFEGTGMSVMELSHRSKAFLSVIKRAEDGIRELLNVPEDYAVLFLQGGASFQFSMLPMNLALPNKPVDVFNTGVWSKKAIAELKKGTPYTVVSTSEDKNFSYIPDWKKATLNPDASYVHLTSNNTIFGTQWAEFPETGDVPLVVDMSSDILCRPLDISKFGVIYAGAQKNIGPSGVTLVIIRKDLVERASVSLPTMLQYRTQVAENSLYNTPPTFGIYMIALVTEWIKSLGGLTVLEKQNKEKAALLYDEIDRNPAFYSPTDKASRSVMNVVFRITGDNEELEAKFVKEAEAANLVGLKGHRSVGGLRASIYNALPKASVEALVSFMRDFSAKNNL